MVKLGDGISARDDIGEIILTNLAVAVRSRYNSRAKTTCDTDADPADHATDKKIP